MQDLEERIRILQNDLQDAKQEIKRKEKQIDTLKKTNKIAEGHSESLRKKILELQKKSSAILLEDDLASQLPLKLGRLQSQSSKFRQEIVRLNQEAQRHKQTITNLQKQNKQLSRANEEQQARISQIQKDQFETEMKKTKFQKIQKDWQRDTQKKKAEYEKKLKDLQKELSKANHTISELKKQQKSQERRNSQQTSSNRGSSSILQSVSEQNRVYFIEPVHLTQSLNQNHLEIPTTHKKLFQLLDIYYERLMPNEKVKFLNMISATAENRLESINEQMELMANMSDE